MAEGKITEEKIKMGDKVISDKKDEKGLKIKEPKKSFEDSPLGELEASGGKTGKIEGPAKGEDVQALIEKMKRAEMKQAMPPLKKKGK
jgi:hypothetical protein